MKKEGNASDIDIHAWSTTNHTDLENQHEAASIIKDGHQSEFQAITVDKDMIIPIFPFRIGIIFFFTARNKKPSGKTHKNENG